MSTHTLYVGDAAAAIDVLPPKSVQLVVTSPPYWSIKDYDHPDQIGHQETYETYLDRLMGVWRGVDQVLEPGCKVAINVGDQFLRAAEHGVYQIAPIHSAIIQQFAQLRNYIYLGGIIWRKITTTKTTGGCTWMGSIYYPRDGYVTYEHEFILLFKKGGKARRPPAEAREASKLTRKQRSEWFRGVWDLPPARQGPHPAMFPLELPDRLIRMFTYVGETVLDPFVGSGTTLQAADLAGRRGIGIELSPVYAAQCRQAVPNLQLHELSHGHNKEASKEAILDIRSVPRGPVESRRQPPQLEQAGSSRPSHAVDLTSSAA